jgi:hypothetical protein
MQYNYSRHCTSEYSVPIEHPLLRRIYRHRYHWRENINNNTEEHESGVTCDEDTHIDIMMDHMIDVGESFAEEASNGNESAQNANMETSDEIESSHVFVQSLKELLDNDYINHWKTKKAIFGKIKQLEIKPGLSVLMYVIHVCNVPQCYVSTLLNIICLGLNIPNNVYQIFAMTFDKLATVINLYETEESKRITFCKKQMQYYTENEVKRRKWRVNSKNFIGCFYFYDIEQVLSLKFDDANYRASLLRGINHIVHLLQNTWPHQVSDINSGRVIRKVREPGEPLSSFLCQRFMLFLDRVALYKSGTESIIPIYAINLNLQAEERYNMENLLLIGIMSTKACSSFHHYLEYAVKIVNKLCEIPVLSQSCK